MQCTFVYLTLSDERCFDFFSPSSLALDHLLCILSVILQVHVRVDLRHMQRWTGANVGHRGMFSRPPRIHVAPKLIELVFTGWWTYVLSSNCSLWLIWVPPRSPTSLRNGRDEQKWLLIAAKKVVPNPGTYWTQNGGLHDMGALLTRRSSRPIWRINLLNEDDQRHLLPFLKVHQNVQITMSCNYRSLLPLRPWHHCGRLPLDESEYC